MKVLTEARSGKERPFRMPKRCPACGSAIARKEGEVAFYCTNAGCAAQSLRRITHFISKNAADMAGLGPKIIARFLDEGLIRDAADLYRLRKEDVVELER